MAEETVMTRFGGGRRRRKREDTEVNGRDRGGSGEGSGSHGRRRTKTLLGRSWGKTEKEGATAVAAEDDDGASNGEKRKKRRRQADGESRETAAYSLASKDGIGPTRKEKEEGGEIKRQGVVMLLGNDRGTPRWQRWWRREREKWKVKMMEETRRMATATERWEERRTAMSKLGSFSGNEERKKEKRERESKGRGSWWSRHGRDDEQRRRRGRRHGGGSRRGEEKVRGEGKEIGVANESKKERDEAERRWVCLDWGR